MCGVVAMRSWRGPISEGALKRATAALRHRGPHGKRCWVSPSARAGLGHTRLTINDPEGDQPIASEDGRRRIIANGEFYDFRRIRRTLQAAGHRFRTRSDTEIALHLYEDEFADCVHRLRGQFAFVIWDEEAGVLFAARDRFGLKPLFCARHNGALVLASEAKALFAAGVTPAWDLRGAYHALHACPDERHSLFDGVDQLPPGHVLVASDAGIRVTRYWDLPPSPRRKRRSKRRRRSPVAEPAEEHAERVRELIVEAVELRLDADVPVGCLLSGGLDSSAVLGIAASRVREPVAAFTVGFARKKYDETAGAREAARAAGADHRVETLGDAELADHFARAVWHAETLQYNAHGVARYLLSRRVNRDGYRAVLAGEGADEAFFGYEFLRAAAGSAGEAGGADDGFGGAGSPLASRALRRLRVLGRLLRSSRRADPGVASVSPWLARAASALDASPALFTRLARGLGYLRALAAPDFLREFKGYDLYRAYYRRCRAAARLPKREPARQLLYLWLHSLFANYHLAADRLDMAHGVEVRLPFLDHRLFEYANSLPLGILAAGPQEKRLLRNAVEPYVPPSVCTRTKRPFWAPPSSGFAANPLHDFVQDTLRGAAMRSVPFVEPAAVVAFLDQLPALPNADRPAADSLLLMLASAAVLQESYSL